MIMPVILLLICAAGVIALAHQRGLAREAWYTFAALAVLVLGTRVTFAVGWWGLVCFPLTFIATGWTLLRGVRDAS